MYLGFPSTQTYLNMGIPQLYYLTHMLSSPRYRNILCWIVGCESSRVFVLG